MEQVEKPEHAHVKCSCCGELIKNSPEENTDFGQNSYDEGFGMCFECGGDPNSDDIRTRLGWAGCTFFDTRIQIVRERLKPETCAKFTAMPYERQVAFIAHLIEQGVMI
jgi:hypothetical protein